MHYADSGGLEGIASSLEAMGVTPAPLLQNCVVANQPLAQFWQANGNQILAAAAKRNSKL